MSGLRPPQIATNSRHFDLLITLIIIVLLLYGGLYPFNFHIPDNGIGPLQAFLATSQKRGGSGDFIANIILFIPFGLFMVRTVRNRVGAIGALITAVSFGGAISTGIELAQYYDVGRVTDIHDMGANTLGTALGAVIGILLRGGPGFPFARDIGANPIPLMLLCSWAGYRLYPYVPVIDLHKYFDSLKPLLVAPQFDPLRFVRQFTFWLAAGTLIGEVKDAKRASWLFPAFIAAILFGEILIVGRSLALDEVAGAACACGAFFILAFLPSSRQAMIAALLLGMGVLLERLEPFSFGPAARRFGWLPFYSFMGGSIDVDVQAFFEKFYLYGSLIWLLVRAGLALRLAASAVAAMLVAASWAEVYLPGRSAEITDGVMALMIAVVFARFKADGLDQRLIASRSSAGQPRKHSTYDGPLRPDYPSDGQISRVRPKHNQVRPS